MAVCDDCAHRELTRRHHSLQARDFDFANGNSRHDAIDDEARRDTCPEVRLLERARTRITIHLSPPKNTLLPHIRYRIVERAVNVIVENDPPPNSPRPAQ